MAAPQRAVFITGGGTGLGAATARLLLAQGQRVAVAGRRADALAQVIGAQAYVLDVRDAAALRAAIFDFAPDALVCSAAILGQGTLGAELTPTRFAEVHAINVLGTFNACEAAFALWRSRKTPGDIVTIASLGGIRGMQKFPGFSAYASSKHAIVGLTEALAIEGKSLGIRVNCLAPGTMATDMTKALGLCPSTSPESVVPTIAYLLDRSLSGPLNGTTIEVHCNDD